MKRKPKNVVASDDPMPHIEAINAALDSTADAVAGLRAMKSALDLETADEMLTQADLLHDVSHNLHTIAINIYDRINGVSKRERRMLDAASNRGAI